MKIGTSLSRCVRDIFNGKVDREDVLVIIARTDVDPEDDKQWNNIWEGYAGDGVGGVYSAPEWYHYQDHETDFREICTYLKKSGKLHQPRQYGAHPPRMEHYWYDVILSEEVVQSNPAAQKAWNNYKLVAGLS